MFLTGFGKTFILNMFVIYLYSVYGNIVKYDCLYCPGVLLQKVTFKIVLKVHNDLNF